MARIMSGSRTETRFRSDWGIPAIYAGIALVAGMTFPRIEGRILPSLVAQVSVSAAMSFYSAIASGMITLTGIVFSFTFVMVQFSATAYSPRLVQWIARDPVISHSLGIFTATFLYAVAALIQVDRSGSGKVPFVSGWIVVLLLLASTGMFIALIRRISLLRVDRMLVFTGSKGREVIEATPPAALAAPSWEKVAEARLRTPVQTLLHRGEPCVVQAVDIEALMRTAADAACVIDLAAAVGDTVVEKTPLLRVYGARSPVEETKLAAGVKLGAERTFEQDPKYAIRLLVDIAIKALSPAINDPTTAVQALDQIEDLLLRLGERHLEVGVFRDSQGELRLLVPSPGWEDLLGLAFSEIAQCGATSVQVMRRLNASVADLASALPDERRGALRHWRDRLNSLVERSFADEESRKEALRADRQGLGASRREDLVEPVI